jgi:hypothetical protein
MELTTVAEEQNAAIAGLRRDLDVFSEQIAPFLKKFHDPWPCGVKAAERTQIGARGARGSARGAAGTIVTGNAKRSAGGSASGSWNTARGHGELESPLRAEIVHMCDQREKAQPKRTRAANEKDAESAGGRGGGRGTAISGQTDKRDREQGSQASGVRVAELGREARPGARRDNRSRDAVATANLLQISLKLGQLVRCVLLNI